MYCFTNTYLAAEQSCVIHFCVKLQKLASEIAQVLKEAYKDQVLGMSIVFQRHKEFLEVWGSLALMPHGGWPTTTSTETNFNTVVAAIWEDWYQSVQTLESLINIMISIKSCLPRIEKVLKPAFAVTIF